MTYRRLDARRPQTLDQQMQDWFLHGLEWVFMLTLGGVTGLSFSVAVNFPEVVDMVQRYGVVTTVFTLLGF